jgi:hypothetical protein
VEASVKQRLYELYIEGRGTCEFRSARAYGVGDRIAAPLAHDLDRASPAGDAFTWAVAAVRAPERSSVDAVLVLEPAPARPLPR